MSISEWFSDEELISQLRSFFTADESEHIDFTGALSTVGWVDENIRQVHIKDRVFQFNVEACDVVEVDLK